MNMQDYEEALIEALKKLIANYEQRVKQNQGIHHNHLSPAVFSGMVGTGASVGGVIGTAIPLPGIGNVIGAATGIVLALGTAGILEAQHYRNNKKIDNAATVMSFFGSDEVQRNQLINKAAHKVVKDRKEILNKIHDPEKAKKPIAAYLAANMMAAIKHSPHSDDKISTMRQGVRDIRSRKVSDHVIENNNSLKLKDIAKFRK